MSKRKRNAVDVSSNPFLRPVDEKQDSKQVKLDHHLIVLDDAMKHKSIRADCAVSVDYILKDLNSGAADRSLSDVALILLPWAIKQVLHNDNQVSLVYRALEACLERLKAAEDQFTVSQSHRILTQSSLFKLVPIVALVASRPVVIEDEEQKSDDQDRSDNEIYDDSESDEDEISLAQGRKLLSSTEQIRQHAAEVLKLLLTFYSATLDVAFKSILLPIVSAMELNHLHTKLHVLVEQSAVNPEERYVLTVSLGWIYRRHFERKGNPKTTFQLLASPSVLLALVRSYLSFDSDCDRRAGMLLCEKKWSPEAHPSQTMIRQFLDDGLFSPQHHLDGFRSLLSSEAASNDQKESKSSFRCYQEELLTGLASSLSWSSSGTDDFCDQICDTCDMATMVPILLYGFMNKANEWNQQLDTKGKKQQARAEDFVRFQFRMFEQLTYPLRTLVADAIKCDQQRVASVALDSLTTCISILLEHKGYLPSHDDPQGTQHRVLETITQELLSFHSSDVHFFGIQQLGSVLMGLQYLFKLDHRLLLDRLYSVVTVCLRCKDTRLNALVASFLETVVETFRLLRQQSQLFRALLQILHSSSADDLEVLMAHLEDPSVNHFLALAIKSSPGQQAAGQFTVVSDTIAGLSSACEPPRKCDLRIVGYLTGLLVTNVRLDGGTVPEIASTCISFLEGPILGLLRCGQNVGKSKGKSATKASLSLFGLFLELHARCAFLLGQTSPLAFPCALAEMLDVSLKKFAAQGTQCFSNGENCIDDFADEWVILYCHRLRQLHVQIQSQDLFPQEDVELETLRSEAETLTCFALTIAYRQKLVSLGVESRWAVLARNVCVWLPYASEPQLELFLNWLFTLISMDPAYPEAPPGSMAMSYRVDIRGIEQEIECANILRRDSSFVSQSRVKSRLRVSALSCSAEWVSWALGDCTTGDSIDDKSLCILARPILGVEDWKRRSGDELEALATHEVTLELVSSVDESLIVSRLKKASGPLKVINGLPNLVESLENSLNFIDSAMRLDHICRSLAKVTKRVNQEAMHFVGTLRLSLALTLTHFAPQDLGPIFGSHGRVTELLLGSVNSAIDMTYKQNHYGESMTSDTKALLIGTRELARHFSCYILAYDVEGQSIANAVRVMLNHQHSRSAEVSRLVLMLSRPILEALTLSISMPLSKVAQALRNQLSEYLLTIAECSNLSKAPSEFYLVLGDLIRFSRKWEQLCPWPNEKLLTSVIDAVKDDTGADHENVSPRTEIGFRYFSACVALNSPEPSLSNRFFQFTLFTTAGRDPLLESSFCQLVRSISHDALVGRLDMLVTRSWADFERDASLLRFLRLLLQCVDRKEHSAVLTSYGPQMLKVALSQLHSSERDETATLVAVEACGVAEELIRSYDILPLRERDLARILAHMSAILGPGIGWTTNQDMRWLSTALYLHCSQVFLCMFQRYTKHLYSCVPSVISLLHSLLARVVYDKTEVSDADITRRGQSFSRLCELLVPHKDIYKKHLLGLILEFVHGLQENMSSVRKVCLLPAVYSLLDSLTSFEMKQLNVLLDPKDKPLFRVFYQSYQKLHMYKGQ